MDRENPRLGDLQIGFIKGLVMIRVKSTSSEIAGHDFTSRATLDRPFSTKIDRLTQKSPVLLLS